MIDIILAAALLSPRQSETFSGTPMFRIESLTPQLIVVPPPQTRYTNSFQWTDVSNAVKDVDGYVLYQYAGATTNAYHTGSTNVTIVYDWPDNVDRWFYYVVATNDWGDSDRSKRIHDPLYPDDRMTIACTSAPFSLERSSNFKTWVPFTNATTPVTVMFSTYGTAFFRRPNTTNATLSVTTWNPLNQ